MSIGLDIGCHRFKSLRRHGERLIGRSCRASYGVLVDSDAHRSLLQQANVSFAVCEDNLVLLGDSSVELCRLFQARSLPLLPGGMIPQVDPLSRQIIAALIESLLPEPNEDGETCCLTLPGCRDKRSETDDRERVFFTHLVQLQGYTPLVYRGGMSVILSELVPESFTGIGISFGAASCDVSLAYHGIEIAHCSIQRGGDWIDEQLARENGDFAWDINGERFLDTGRARSRKESVFNSLHQPTSQEERLLASLYRDLLSEVVQKLVETFQKAARLDAIRHPVSMVCTGGTARVPGFRSLLDESLKAIRLPLEVKDLRVAADGEYTVARGCLINGELESEALQSRLHAA